MDLEWRDELVETGTGKSWVSAMDWHSSIWFSINLCKLILVLWTEEKDMKFYDKFFFLEKIEMTEKKKNCKILIKLRLLYFQKQTPSLIWHEKKSNNLFFLECDFYLFTKLFSHKISAKSSVNFPSPWIFRVFVFNLLSISVQSLLIFSHQVIFISLEWFTIPQRNLDNLKNQFLINFYSFSSPKQIHNQTWRRFHW